MGCPVFLDQDSEDEPITDADEKHWIIEKSVKKDFENKINKYVAEEIYNYPESMTTTWKGGVYGEDKIYNHYIINQEQFPYQKWASEIQSQPDGTMIHHNRGTGKHISSMEPPTHVDQELAMTPEGAKYVDPPEEPKIINTKWACITTEGNHFEYLSEDPQITIARLEDKIRELEGENENKQKRIEELEDMLDNNPMTVYI